MIHKWRIASRAKRVWLFRLAAVLLALAVTLGLLETAAIVHLVDYRAVFASGPLNALGNPHNRFDPELIFVHRAHGKFVGTSSGDVPHRLSAAKMRPVDVRYDEHGFRNAACLNRADLVLIGDSYIESALVPQEKLVSTRLACALGRPVLNLGHVGYGPQQERVVLQRHGLPAQPQVVIWAFCEGNDLEDWHRYNWQHRELAAIEHEMHSLKKRCFTRNLIQAARQRWHHRPSDPNLAQRYAGVWRGAPDESMRTLYFFARHTPLDERDCEALAGVEEILLEADAACRARGARLLLLYVPTKFRVYRDLCEFAPDSEPAKWQVHELPEQMRGWAASRQIAFLDLTTALHAAAAAGRLVYFTDDTHWNEDGSDVVAHEIVAFLRQHEWLGASSSSKPTLRGRVGKPRR